MYATRRDLLRLAAAGTLSSLTRCAMPQSQSRSIGFCIVGLGRISMENFMPGLKLSQGARVAALVSGNRDKAERLAAQYNVPATGIYSYEQYDAIAQNPAIDAVYVALPNSMHAEYTVRAAQAGKHVLCEKPMATSVADAEAMIAACAKANKKLMIAYRCHYEPLHLRAITLVREGRIGKIQAVESTFGFNIAPKEWRLDRRLAGGGPMMDVGVYCLNACRYLTGEEPSGVKGYLSVVDHDGRFDQVEENLSWSMQFPSGVVASCATSYGTNMGGFFRVVGSKGTLRVDPAFYYDGVRLSLKVEGQPPLDDVSSLRDPYQFIAQAEHFAACILGDKTPKTPGEEGLRDMKLMMEIYRSCETSSQGPSGGFGPRWPKI